MLNGMFLLTGGFACGFTAGAAARYGRICSMSAIEDALLAKDYRGARAWGLAVAVAIGLTHLLSSTALLDLEATLYGSPRLDLLGAALGGLAFGLGMALMGTCSFGLLVRAGSGDMRALVSAFVVGIAAIAFTSGVLAPVRMWLGGWAALDLASRGGALAPGLLARQAGLAPATSAPAIAAIVIAVVALPALLDSRLRRRPRMLVGAIGLGTSIAAGWLVTAMAVERMESPRPESLSFVAPVGRLLLQAMTNSIRDADFGIGAVLGVVAGASTVAVLRRDVRWEAFDDVREMSRHCLGAVLMGMGGVLARGCTIGQGMSAASALAVSAPIVVLAILVGAKIGLAVLLEGRAAWRLGQGA